MPRKTVANVQYPPLPKSVAAPGGRIKVKMVKGDVKYEDENGKSKNAWGAWEEHTRTILMSRTCPPKWMWKVFYHELAHATIMDAGIDNLISDELHETLCDAFATARVRERWG